MPVLDVDLTAVPVLTHGYAPLPPADDECAAFARTLSDEELATLLVGADVRGEERLVNVMGASGSTTSKLYESRSIPNIVLFRRSAGAQRHAPRSSNFPTAP